MINYQITSIVGLLKIQLIFKIIENILKDITKKLNLLTIICITWSTHFYMKTHIVFIRPVLKFNVIPQHSIL